MVTIYIYDTDSDKEPCCSLQPQPEGCDDGGRDYTLPRGYTEKDGQLCSPCGDVCELKMHNGAPLLVDKGHELAFLLEQERKVEQRRELLGMTRQQLADAVGMTQYELYQLEHHEVEPGSAVLGRIAAVLQCDTIDLT